MNINEFICNNIKTENWDMPVFDIHKYIKEHQTKNEKNYPENNSEQNKKTSQHVNKRLAENRFLQVFSFSR